VKAAVIDGHAPSFEAISDGRYIVSRPLYFYVKKAHVLMIPGVKARIVQPPSHTDNWNMAIKALH